MRSPETARVIPIIAAGGPQAEVARVMQICNACRYCEGFCAVFPAMTRRLTFDVRDAHYLANLCHNCGACLHACQYAPPHEFGVNVPQAMARVRRETYAEHAWPAPFAALYRRNGIAVALALTLALALFLALGAASRDSLWQALPQGNFYAVFPHGLMVALFAPLFGFAALALGIGTWRFWRGQSAGAVPAAAAVEALRDALTLRYLDGGHGQGCNEANDAFTLRRRRFHHLTAGGFLLCFAATGVATLMHYGLGLPAPYPWTSPPKLLGIAGGVLLLVGATGLLHLNLRRHPQQQDVAQRPMDRAFIALLLLVAASGLLLMLLRASAAMPLLLCLHLGSVMALFATLPYGKFAHAVYRGAALLKWAVERRSPNALQLSED
jgi:citrate/tricarballylate utilization protein